MRRNQVLLHSFKNIIVVQFSEFIWNGVPNHSSGMKFQFMYCRHAGPVAPGFWKRPGREVTRNIKGGPGEPEINMARM